LREGAAGEMQWMARGVEKRCDPQEVLPGARSIIIVALNYWQGRRQRRERRAASRATLGRRLPRDDVGETRAAERVLTGLGGTQKCYVDTGRSSSAITRPRPGIGWHGKSTMLIDPKLGTWFFLGEILTTLNLSPDQPQPSRCGSCQRCITACPTGRSRSHTGSMRAAAFPT